MSNTIRCECDSCRLAWEAEQLAFEQSLSADDVKATRLDRCPWNGRVHDDLRLQVAEQILRDIRDNQIGATSTVKALCAAYFEVMG